MGPGSRVWSAAHGHWHVVNADGGETEARPGQVWSPEHGHWHDAEPLSGARPKHFTSTVQGDLEQAEAGIEP